MCTITWWREEDRYGALFNRDELKTRPRADPPFVWPEGFLSPRDPPTGGTWLAVNRDGLILALLNRWHEGAKGTQSRGQIIPALIHLKIPEEWSAALGSMKLADYSPFTLVAIDSRDARRFDWDGQKLSNELAEAPITSSSFRFEDVSERRRAAYRETIGSKPGHRLLDKFHRESSRGAYSVRMCRPDAQTWSRSRIAISPGKIMWEYDEEFPDFHRSPKIWNAVLA
jgi:hypothetical protein